MPDIEKDEQIFQGPVTIGTYDANKIAEILHGTCLLTWSAGVLTMALATASAAITGLTAAHKIFLVSQSAATGEALIMQNVMASAGSFSCSALNSRSSTISPVPWSMYYFAIR